MHAPVLVKELISLLDVQPGDTVLDCTVGSGGAAHAICGRIGPNGCLIGLDRDIDAIHRAKRTLSDVKSKVLFYKSNFADLDSALDELGVKAVDRVMFDLGLSSEQLEAPERGFSFLHDGPLDMRMDPTSDLTARDLINRLSQNELGDLLYHFGEEYEARKLSRAIIRARSAGAIKTTHQLADIIKRAVSPKRCRMRIHPATKTFQALRIAVNKELENIEAALPKAEAALKPGGKIAVISFHSLEDRIVKNYFREGAKRGRLIVITKKVVKPTDEEIRDNPRSRSARLRVAETRS